LGAFDYVVLVFILLASIFIGLYQGFKQKCKLFLHKIFKPAVKLNNEHIEFRKISPLILGTTTTQSNIDETNNHDITDSSNGAAPNGSVLATPLVPPATVDQTEQDNSHAKLNDYLTAHGSMNVLPVTFSLLASFFSAVSLIGTPSEVYQYGIEYLVVAISYATTPLLGAFITGPFFADLKILSVFEYIEKRYGDRKARIVGDICYIFRALTLSAMATLGPAAAVSLIMNLDQNITIALIGFIGTCYTAIGGNLLQKLV
jgi:hypothetical protein